MVITNEQIARFLPDKLSKKYLDPSKQEEDFSDLEAELIATAVSKAKVSVLLPELTSDRINESWNGLNLYCNQVVYITSWRLLRSKLARWIAPQSNIIQLDE